MLPSGVSNKVLPGGPGWREIPTVKADEGACGCRPPGPVPESCLQRQSSHPLSEAGQSPQMFAAA